MDNHQKVDNPEENSPVLPQVMTDNIGVVITGIAFRKGF
ncbi:hypothetical protein ECW26_10470 [Escherichia coli W26]|nr:hypothetical protein ECW26_10470 [Escherichia coli W26]